MDHKKYHQIQTQIEEARIALQNWNDRRAEAMIELDSIFTEIEAYKQQVSEENEKAQNTITELKLSVEKGDREFHKHFESYTNDMQEIKLENETLSRSLKEALNEIENQKLAQKKMEVHHLKKIAETAAATEIRVADQQFQLKTQITNLVAELQSVQSDKKILAQKAALYEKELHVIRSQMMSFLNVTKDVVGTNVLNANALNPVSSSDAAPSLMNLIIDQGANPPSTVNDYLKKFGY